tara:strand:- start:544 stop:771 length:228 start_codon:yes stop_codon:yes gene_type:complete
MSTDNKEAFIKTPKQLILVILASFIIPILIIVLLVKFVSTSTKTGAGSNSQTPEAIAKRIMPIADENFNFKNSED